MATIIPRFLNMIDTQFNKKIECFRSDNAKQLSFIDFFNERGVVHQFSCVDRPQQFSRGQKHKHLLNVALALYFHSRVPIQFWSDCVLTATFLKTGLPLHY